MLQRYLLALLVLGGLVSCGPTDLGTPTPTASLRAKPMALAYDLPDAPALTLTWSGGGPLSGGTNLSTCLQCGSSGYRCPGDRTSSEFTKQINYTVPAGLLVVGIKAQVYGATVSGSNGTVTVKLNTSTLKKADGSTSYSSTSRTCSTTSTAHKCEGPAGYADNAYQEVALSDPTNQTGIGWQTGAGEVNQLIFEPTSSNYCLSHVKLTLTVAERRITGSAPALDFKTQQRGTASTTQTLTVENPGDAPLTISNIEITGTGANGFEVISPTDVASNPIVVKPKNDPNATAAEKAAQIQVKFSPGDTLSYARKLTITSDAKTQLTPVDLLGTGVEFATEVDQSPLDFGTVRAGTDKTLQVKVRNVGANTLTVSPTFATGSNPGFSITSPTGTSFTVARGAETTMTVNFRAPSDTEARVEGDLLLGINGDPSPGNTRNVSIHLQGTPIRPILAPVAGTTLAFEDVRAGQPKELPITVTNEGSAPITFDSVQTQGHAAFTITNRPTGSVTLAAKGQPGSSLPLTVRFLAPTTTETEVEGSIAFTRTTPDPLYPNNYNIRLTGRGVKPQLVPAPPTELPFGDVRAGQSKDLPITLSNEGTGPITFTSITKDGHAAFSVTNRPTGSVTLAPKGQNGSTLTLTVRFQAPTDTELPLEGRVLFTSSDPDPAYQSFNVRLTGRAVKPVLLVNPVTELAFGNVRAGQAKDLPITLSNEGLGPITLGPIGQDGNAAFTLTNKPAGSVTLAPKGLPGSTLTLNVRFLAPTTTDLAVEGRVLFTSSDPDPAYQSFNVRLTGRAVKPILVVDPATELPFEDVRAGQTKDLPITLSNEGTGPITFSSITKDGHAAFTITNRPAGSVTLAPKGQAGSTLTLTVRFLAPTTTDLAVEGRVLFTSSDPEPTYQSFNVRLTGRAIKPVLVMTPATELAFGDVRAGEKKVLPFILSNEGTGPITLSSIVTSGHAAFTLTNKPTGSVTLAAKDQGVSSLTLNVEFLAPSDTEFPVEGALNFTSTDSDPSYQSFNIKLRGRGVKPQIAPVSPLAFNEVRVMTSKTMTVTLQNTGSSSVTFSEVFIQGDPAFTLEPARNRTTPLEVPPGTTTLTVKFSPTIDSPTPVQGTLTLFSADPAVPHIQVGLSGTGVQPFLQVDKTPIVFADQNVGAPGASFEVQLFNTGSGKLYISDITTTNTAFSVSPKLAFDVTKAGGPRTLTVTFNPGSVNPFTGELKFKTNDPTAGDATTGLVSIPLSGNGKRLLKIVTTPVSDPPRIDFGNVPIATGSWSERTFTIINDGTETIRVEPPTFAAGSPFSSTTLSTFVDLNRSRPSVDITVRFTPQITTTVSELFEVKGTASVAPQITLLGKGAQPQLQVTVLENPELRELNFGSLPVNDRALKYLVIKNIGDATLRLTGFAIESATTSSPFDYQNPAKTDLAPQDSVQLPVSFTPTSNGSFEARLRIDSNAAGGSVRFPLLGTGVSASIKLSDTGFVFEDKKLKQTSEPRLLTISNQGKAELLINQIAMPTGYVILSPTTLPSVEQPWRLAPNNGFVTVSVAFRPTTLGRVDGTMRIYSNSIDNSFALNGASPVVLSGVGRDGMGLVDPPKEYVFATTDVEVTSRFRVKVENTGDFNLAVRSATISSITPGTSPFTITGFTPGSVLLPGRANYIEFFVNFTPKYRDDYQAELIIDTDSETIPRHTVTLKGAARGALAVFPSTSIVNFGSTNVQSSVLQTVSVQNQGESPLVIQEVIFTGSAPDGGTVVLDDRVFSVETGDGGTNLPLTVAPTVTSPIVLKFRPIAEGVRSAFVTVKSNARDLSKEVRGEGTAPVLELTPAKVEFPGVLVGSYSKTEIITIKNRGTGLLQVKSISLPPAAVGSFELQHADLYYTLGPQDTLPVSVTFLPTAEKSSLDVQLTVTAVESRVAPVSMRLVGKGVIEPITVERNVDFGRQLVNNRAYRTLQIKNETADPISFISAAVDTAPGCSQFKGDALPSGGITLEPFTTKEYRVAFTPQSTGLLSNCVMRLGFGQLRDKIDVTLSGQGISTLLSIDKTLIDFKSVRAGGPKLTEQFTITNLSSDNVQLSAPEVTFSTGAAFRIDLDSLTDKYLEPNVPLPITVEYQPMEATSSVTKLAFGTKSPQQLRVVALELKGEATLRILDVDPTTPLDWERVELNGAPQVKTVTVTNSSTQEQKVRLAIKTGSGSPFSANVNGSVNNIDIPAQGSIKLDVMFLPSKIGSVEDEVQVMLQDVATPEVTITVKGVGQVLTGRGGADGCSCGSTGMGSTGLLAMLTLLGLRSRRRKQE